MSLLNSREWVREGGWKKFLSDPLPPIRVEPGSYADVEEQVFRKHYVNCTNGHECVVCELLKYHQPLNTERPTSLGYGLIPLYTY